MLGTVFRPWGSLAWVLGKVQVASWSVLACHGTEERSLAAWEILTSQADVDSALFIEVQDPPSRFSAESAQVLKARHDELRRIGLPSRGIAPLNLFSTEAQIVSAVDDFLSQCGPNVLFDITSFPKRMFFPFIKRVLQSRQLEHIIVTYSVPAAYGEVLAEDHQTLQHLPLFGANQFPEPAVEFAFVGVGFSPLGLPELLEPYKKDVTVKLFFPFPPGPPAFQRNWSFVAEIKKRLPPNGVDPIRVGAYDVPDVFEHICKLTDRGQKYSVFAPYGPKPVSLAMCLYAVSTGSAVYYTQPTKYNPAYSTGVKRIGANPETYAYCLRISGRDIYSV